MISLDLTKSSEVRKAGDQFTGVKFIFLEHQCRKIMDFLKGKMGTQVFLHFFRKRNVNFLSHERNYLINILHELNSILQSELIKDHTTTSAFSTNRK